MGKYAVFLRTFWLQGWDRNTWRRVKLYWSETRWRGFLEFYPLNVIAEQSNTTKTNDKVSLLNVHIISNWLEY